MRCCKTQGWQEVSTFAIAPAVGQQCFNAGMTYNIYIYVIKKRVVSIYIYLCICYIYIYIYMYMQVALRAEDVLSIEDAFRTKHQGGLGVCAFSDGEQ